MDNERMSPLERHIVDHYLFYVAACIMTVPLSRVIEPKDLLSLALLLAWCGATFRLIRRNSTPESKLWNAVLSKKTAKYFIACFALHALSIVLFNRHYLARHSEKIKAIVDAVPMSSNGGVDPKYDFALMHGQIRLMLRESWWQAQAFALGSLIITLALFWILYKKAREEAESEYQAQARGLTS
jgi:hypothetical protein